MLLAFLPLENFLRSSCRQALATCSPRVFRLFRFRVRVRLPTIWGSPPRLCFKPHLVFCAQSFLFDVPLKFYRFIYCLQSYLLQLFLDQLFSFPLKCTESRDNGRKSITNSSQFKDGLLVSAVPWLGKTNNKIKDRKRSRKGDCERNYPWIPLLQLVGATSCSIRH